MKHLLIFSFFLCWGTSQTGFAQSPVDLPGSDIDLLNEGLTEANPHQEEVIYSSPEVLAILSMLEDSWTYNTFFSEIDGHPLGFPSFKITLNQEPIDPNSYELIELKEQFPQLQELQVHAMGQVSLKGGESRLCFITTNVQNKIYFSYIDGAKEKVNDTAFKSYSINIERDGKAGMKLLYLMVESSSPKIAVFIDTYVNYQPSKENITANHLIGSWEYNKDLAKTLGTDREEFRSMSARFELDTTVLDSIPLKYYPLLKEKMIYLAGRVTLDNEATYPFILVERAGTPHIVYFRERHDEPYGDGEFFYLNAISGINKQSDLLFIGGDFPEEPFIPFKRKK